MASALQGLRVLDAEDTVAGQYCGRLLADYGAEVWLLEPPTGSPVRRVGPFRGTAAAPEDSLLFWHLNVGKRSATLKWRTTSGAAILRRLADRVDVVIGPGELPGGDLRATNSGLITCAITGFGPVGPRSDWLGCELVYQALSGFMYLTGAPGRPPLYGVGQRSLYACGITAYVAIMAALHARNRDGVGQAIEVNAMEASAALNGFAVPQHSYTGTYQARSAPGSSLVQCADGWVVLYSSVPDWSAVCAVFDLADYVDDPRFRHIRERTEHAEEAHVLIQARAAHLTVDEVCSRAQRRKVPVGRVLTAGELWASEHLKARGYWQQVDGRPVLGPAFRMSATSRQLGRGAPALGEGTWELYEQMGVRPSEMRSLRDGGVA